MGVFFTTNYRGSEIAAHHHCLVNEQTRHVTLLVYLTSCFCLQLFAAGLQQRGTDSEGFAGFLVRDVQNESERCRRLVSATSHINNNNLDSK